MFRVAEISGSMEKVNNFFDDEVKREATLVFQFFSVRCGSILLKNSKKMEG